MNTYPVSQTQMGIYAATVNAQEEGNYNIDMLYTLCEDVDIDRLAHAIDRVIEAHPSVKCRLTTDESGDLIFEDHSDEPFHTTITGIASIDEVSQHLGADFDLTNDDRLFRVEIYRTPERNYLYVDFHHIIFDGMSFVTFNKEVELAYSGQAVEAEAMTAFDLTLRDNAVRDTDAYQQAKDWYRSVFSAASGIDSLPQGDVKGKADEHFVSVDIPVGITSDAITDFCSKTKVKESMLFTSAFAYLLSRYSGNKEVLFSTIYHGRPDRDTRRTFAMMVKTLPVYTDFSRTENTEGLIDTISNQLRQSRMNTCYSFGELNADLGLTCNICFAYQGTLNNFRLFLDGKEQEARYLRKHHPGIKLNVKVISMDGKYVLRVEYPTNRYTSEFISGLCLSYGEVIKEMMTGTDLRHISVMSDTQRAEVSALRRTATASVPYKRFFEPIEHYAQVTPDATALIACDRSLTYRQLDQETNRIAHRLVSRGVAAGDRIVLLLPRTSDVICCMFGVSKAGAAYIPCDPAYPADRIRLIIEDSGAKYVITTDDHLDAYKDKAIAVRELVGCMGLSDMEDSQQTRKRPDVSISPDSLVYLIYTSGSTGRPKGVMLRHEAICNYLYDHEANRHIHALTEEGVRNYLCITTLSFDMSLKEFGGAILNGLTCVLANEDETENPILLADLMRRNDVEALNGTPSRLLGYMEIPEFEEALHNCKVILSGGESYSPVLLDRLHSIKGLRIFNTYGPTEITVSSNVAELTDTSHITVGQPLLNYHEWVVDADGNELPVGVVGELLIGGIGVAAGYNNLPDKTAAAFIEYDGMRVYKSGDYARWTRDGKIEILGRMDGQIKLHGLRIEIGEIESCINRCKDIKQSLVKVCKKNDDEFLVAYFTATTHIDTDALKAEISQTLTHYMVPSAFMQLDSFPLTPNGKTDVRNLPVPEVKPKSVNPETSTGLHTLNILEREIKDITAPILKTDAFGSEDSLALYGLTSLSAIKLATLIFRRYGIQIKPQRLVREGSLLMIENEILNALLSPSVTPRTHDTVAPSAPESETPTSAPLTFAQTGVYYDIVKNPGSTAYNMPTLYSFPEGVTADMIVSSLKSVIAAHPILSTHFSIDGTDVVQVDAGHFVPEVNVVSVGSEEELERLKTDFIKPFNPSAGPLYRATVVMAKGHPSPILLLDTLHLVMDGASKAIFNRQLAEAIEGKTPQTETYTYFSHANDEKASVGNDEYKESERFFTERLKTVDGVSNITEDVTPQEGDHPTLLFADYPVDHSAMAKAAKEMGVTPAQLFLAAAFYTVSRYTNTKDVCLCTISNGRGNLAVSDTVGMFVNTIAVTSHIADVTVADFVKTTADDFARSLDHENYPFAQVAEKFGLVPTIFFQYQVGIREALTISKPESGVNGEMRFGHFGDSRPKFKFTISIEETGIQIQYDSTLYSPSLAQGFADSMGTVLSHMTSKPDAMLTTVSMLTPAQSELISSFHVTKRAEVPIQLYHKLFEASAEAHADSPALVALNPFSGIYDTITYAHLNGCMNRIAWSLIRRGVKPGDRVALLLPRTSRLIMSQYGVLKAGGAYIPCDPKYPTERINLILEDSESKYIITTADRLSEFPGKAIDVEE
ncbi:MAG: amino acid adenylation domain-containing protein, partial [Bacteroidaceae bacterium]|nr:amino acid adenylation domain-containing protein [Bacteroidaceae bacterium]